MSETAIAGSVSKYPHQSGGLLADLSFRPLSRSDFPLLEHWLSRPHVETWWHEPLDAAGVEAKYGPRVDGVDPVHLLMIALSDRPIGWIQWYRWADYPEHAAQLGAPVDSAGLDLAIGDETALGLGYGLQALRKLADHVKVLDPAIRSLVADPDKANIRSVRAFEKAGFVATKLVRLRGEAVWRKVMWLELDSG